MQNDKSQMHKVSSIEWRDKIFSRWLIVAGSLEISHIHAVGIIYRSMESTST